MWVKLIQMICLLCKIANLVKWHCKLTALIALNLRKLFKVYTLTLREWGGVRNLIVQVQQCRAVAVFLFHKRDISSRTENDPYKIDF